MTSTPLMPRVPFRPLRDVAILVLLLTLASCSRDSDRVRGSGTVEMDEVDIASMVGGRVVQLRVDEGDAVHAGDTLAVLDRGEIAAELVTQAARAQSAQAQYRDLASGARPAEVMTARADVTAAEAASKFTESEFDRASKLLAEGAVAQSEVDRLRSERDAARARLRAAREKLNLQEQGYRRQQVAAARDAAEAANAQLAGARSRLGELYLVAPADGVVLLRNYEPGEVAGSGSPVLTLGNPDSLWIRVYIAAPKLGGVRLGAPVEVVSRGAPGKRFAGRVVEISSRAEFTPRAALTEEEQSNIVFAVKVALDPTAGALKAGLPADAFIRAAR